MSILVTSRVKYKTLHKTTLVNSKGKSYKVAFNLATKYSNWSIQLSLFHKLVNKTLLVQNWTYNPKYKSVRRTLCVGQNFKWSCVKDWSAQNNLLKALVYN